MFLPEFYINLVFRTNVSVTPQNELHFYSSLTHCWVVNDKKNNMN